MTAGEGGAIVTNDDHLADLLYGLKDCGRRRIPDSPPTFGSNNRMTEFQAAVLIGQLQRLPELMERRTENINYLRDALRSVAGVSVLDAKPQVTRQGIYCLSVEINDQAFSGMPRDLIVDALNAEGIPVTPPYDIVYRSILWKPSEKLWKFAPRERSEARAGPRIQMPGRRTHLTPLRPRIQPPTLPGDNGGHGRYRRRLCQGAVSFGTNAMEIAQQETSDCDPESTGTHLTSTSGRNL